MSIEKCLGCVSIRYVLILMYLTYENIDNNIEVTYNTITNCEKIRASFLVPLVV